MSRSRFPIPCLAAALAALLLPAAAPAGETHRSVTMRDSIIDPAALNFPDGPWGTCVNGQTYQQEAVVSFNGRQYAAYFGAGGALCVARRTLPAGPWEVIRFADYTIATPNDTHNVATIGIAPDDGTIHLFFDHHCSPLHYRRSVPGLATRPAEVPWTAAAFGPVTDAVESGKPLSVLTYPMQFTSPAGKLQLCYRLGGSGDGDWYLAEYDGGKGAWASVGMLLHREGTYRTSPSRCAYPNSFRYDGGGRLHMTWCWRERPQDAPFDLRTNHDICYAFSDDAGRTWNDNGGRLLTQINRSGAPRPLGIATPGLVVRETRFLWGQMNTNTQFVDGRGRVHLISWQQPQDAAQGSKDLNPWRYYHYWRAPDGTWTTNLLPFQGRKPQLVLDRNGRAFVLFAASGNRNYHGADPGGRLTLMSASEASGWRDWEPVWTLDAPLFVGEPQIDHGRWLREGVLTVYVQEKPDRPGAPSPLHAMDLTPAPVP